MTTITQQPRVLTGHHFMLGDHACSEGALAAGCQLFAGYPITPSTETAERLSQRMPQVGGIFLQMEDELGSMAALVGASMAGVRAMTATSGPGFSLMMENIGLAAMMEAPCVVVNIQRGSPSTGLPTLVGQSDVMQVKWGSHGDYEIIAYAPSSPQECFDYVIKAFNASDRWRVPAFVMADELIGHMTERVVIPPEDEIPRVERKTTPYKPEDGKYLPFLAEDEDLVPPFVKAGDGYRIHVTSLTHDERGYPATFPEPHDKLVRRLVNKIRLHTDQIIEYDEVFLDDAEVAVVAYGSTSRSARRAVNEARADGIKVGLLRLITLWPFPENKIRQLSDQVSAFIVPELNLGQMSRETERFTSKPVIGVNHAGGVMMAPGPILEAIREAVK